MTNLYNYILESIMDVDDNIDNVKPWADLKDVIKSMRSSKKFYEALNSLRNRIRSTAELARPSGTRDTVTPKPKTLYIMFFGREDSNGNIVAGGVHVMDGKKTYSFSDYNGWIKIDTENVGVRRKSSSSSPWDIYFLPDDMVKDTKNILNKI